MISFRPICGAILLGSFLPVAAEVMEFEFKDPHREICHVEQGNAAGKPLVEGKMQNGAAVKITGRLAVRLKSPKDLNRLTAGHSLELNQIVSDDLFILQAPDAWTALQQAHRLAQSPEVIASCPVMIREFGAHNAYAGKPNDPYFSKQWHLENRNSTNGASLGVDLNVRAAWPVTRGEGTIIAIGDTGIDYTHPDLATSAVGTPHTNLIHHTSDGLPADSADNHGTPVAGLAVAELNNQIGISGTAPGAKMASWKILGGSPSTLQVDDQSLMNMFQYQSNIVTVQNHSWGSVNVGLAGPGFLAAQGISNAVQFGRGGRGEVIIRSAGNLRVCDDGLAAIGNANDDGWVSNPDVIGVGAVRRDGRVASYSNPGACLLVSAPSDEIADLNYNRDPSYGFLFTTDRPGTDGYNTSVNTNDYVFTSTLGGAFGETSGAAPQIAGLAALIISANTNLGYRDVQQILLQSARHFDLTDPDVTTNGAGFRISHNVGFGTPDGGFAVALAKIWSNRPARTNISFASTNTFTSTNPAAITDDGLRVVISNAPAFLQTISATPSLGPHVDVATAYFPLVEVTNLATNTITQNLTNKVALIQRGGTNYQYKIRTAANAGAAMAIIYNNAGTTNRVIMGQGSIDFPTDFVPIPAVFISKNDGDNLHSFLLTNANPNVQLKLLSTNCTFNVTNTLVCEHVAVRIQTTHQRRGEVRVTLLSPSGTRSVLQRLNTDTVAGPVDWTYYSTHHFYESSYGTWTVSVSDENYPDLSPVTGAVQGVTLTVFGVPITDTDHDGLDDNWEKANFTNSLAFGPKDDPDKDGFNNMREYLLGSNPNNGASPFAFQADLSRWDNRLARLSWPANSNYTYEVRAASNVTNLTAVTNLSGQFPQMEFFTAYTNSPAQFFNVRAAGTP